MRRMAVFASGTGSNFEAIVRAARSGQIPAKVVLLVCDRPGAPVIAKAQATGIPVFVAAPKTFPDKVAYERAVLARLHEKDVTFIALAGYMRLIGPTLLNAYPERIVNIHPSLLPAFPGRNAIARALEAGVKVTGVTIHYVDSGIDSGPIIAQRAVEILEGDTVETLSERIHRVEHVLYPETLARLLKKENPMGITYAKERMF